jgi:segregation and condensation protein A
MYTITLPTFEGPLDLLLRLIERAELDITSIALAQVADQYLAHVRMLNAPDPHALAEFVTLAARLLLIKSHALLPRPAVEEPPLDRTAHDARALVRQLREYQRYRHAAALLRAWQEQGRQMFERVTPVTVAIEQEYPPLEHTLAELVNATRTRKKLAAQPQPTIHMPQQRRLTVAEVTRHIGERLALQVWVEFDDLLEQANARQDVVVSFWAVLELLKQHQIMVEQQVLFGPIRIRRGEMKHVSQGET